MSSVSRHIIHLRGDVDSEIFEVVEEMPQLVGGLNTLANQIRYPDGAEGTAVVVPVIDEQDSAADADVYREITEEIRLAILVRIAEARLEQSANVEVRGLTSPGQSKIE